MLTADWLQMLQKQSASTTDEWHQLQRSKRSAVVNSARLDTVSMFYSSKELQWLLHPRAPALHSAALYTDIQGTITVTGDNCTLAVFQNSLCDETVQIDVVDINKIYLVDIYLYSVHSGHWPRLHCAWQGICLVSSGSDACHI
jgi:hypothetical protein